MICSNKVSPNSLLCADGAVKNLLTYSILHRFGDITTSAVHVTTCDLEKSFTFDKTVEITRHVRFSTRVNIHSKYVLHFTRHGS